MRAERTRAHGLAGARHTGRALHQGAETAKKTETDTETDTEADTKTDTETDIEAETNKRAPGSVGNGEALSVHARDHAAQGATLSGGRRLRVCMHVLGVGRMDVRVMREATALVGAGYDVTVVDFERDAARPRREDAHGVHFRHIIMPSRFRASRIKVWFLVKLAIAVVRAAMLMTFTPADVYHAHDDNALYACSVAATLRGRALVFDAHELPLVQPNLTRWRRLCAIASWALRRMASRCAAVITVSPPLVEELQRRFGGPRAVVVRNIPPYTPPIASDRLRERLGLGPDARIALYQGRFQENRSLELLVRAARYLGPHEYIALMGWGPTEQQLAALIAHEAVGDRIKLLPAAPYDELLTWTASADVGLNIFDQDFSPSIRDCLPNKLFEYIMAGVPVLTSHLPAVVEIIQRYEAGAITASIAPEEIARSLHALLSDAEQRARMRQHAFAAAQRELRWEVEQQRLVALYRQTFGAPARVLGSQTPPRRYSERR